MLYKLLGVVVLSTIPFLFSLDGDFVFDDSEAILKNKDVSSGSWLNSFYNDFWGTNIKSNFSHKSYRPLTTLSFRLNYYVNSKTFSPISFKITNLLCHILCCILVWRTFQIIIHNLGCRFRAPREDTAYMAALIFSVHPVHVESISGIVGRADLLAGITFFSAFLCYNKAMTNSKTKYLYLTSTIILAATSMLCKENGITVLGFCIVYEVVIKLDLHPIMYSKKSSNKIKNLTLAVDKKRLLILVLSIMVILYGRWMVMGGVKPDFKAIDNPAAFSSTLFTKVATYNYIYVINLLLLIWPQWLCYDWSMGCIPLIEKLHDHRLLMVLFLYIYGLLALYAIVNIRNNKSIKRLIILASSMMILPFLPASNLFYPVGFVVAERVLYIPSAGYCLLVAIGFNKIVFRKIYKYKIKYMIYLLLILAYSLRSWQRSYDWRNEYELYLKGLDVCPLNAKVHYNVAKVSDAKDQSKKAIEEYKVAIRLYPDYYQAMNNLANLLKNLKKYEEAEYYLRNALKIKQDFPAAWMNLGIVLASLKQYTGSLEAYKTALEYRKNYPDCLYNLGNLFLEMNKTEDAINSWLKAISYNETHVLSWTNLLALLDNTGQIVRAAQIIPDAIRALPESPTVNFAIANIYGKMDMYSEAEVLFHKSIRLFGKKVQAIHYSNLGVLYHRWKKYEEAEKMYKNSLMIDPLFKSALKNLKAVQKLIMNS